MDIRDGKAAATTGGEAVRGEVRAERWRELMDIGDGTAAAATNGGAGIADGGRVWSAAGGAGSSGDGGGHFPTLLTLCSAPTSVPPHCPSRLAGRCCHHCYCC
jgi:hypothetical protein